MYEFKRFIPTESEHLRLSGALMDASWGGSDYARSEFIAWQYLSNPVGPLVGFLVFPEFQNQLACQYVTIPNRLWSPRSGSELRALLSVNTVTHPAHRKKGLFVEAARRTFDAAVDDGYDCVFGFPNDSSLPGFKRLDFIELEPLQLFVSLSQPLAALRKAGTLFKHRKFPPLIQGAVRSNASRSDWIKHVARLISSPNAVLKQRWHVPRDEAWLEWRYWDHPTWQYSFFVTTTAAFVIRFMKLGEISIAIVMDAIGDPTDGCIASLRGFIIQEHPAVTCGVFSRDLFLLYPALRSLLRWRVPTRIAPKQFHVIHHSLRKPSVPPESCFFCLGDFDLY